MIFHEIYGTYFSVIAAILKKASAGTLLPEDIRRITAEQAFGESILTIPDALTDGTWPLLDEHLETPLQHAPSMPVTGLQLQWLKTILNDPRVRLFSPSPRGLEDVIPLYDSDDVIFFDRSRDADPFEDPDYIAHFRTVLHALHTKKSLQIRYAGRRRELKGSYIPLSLEYSEKDDKFRLYAAKAGSTSAKRRKYCTLNLASILDVCELEKGESEEGRETGHVPKPLYRKSVVLELTDDRNALERALWHFSDLEKETTDLGDSRYRILLRFHAEDETEILIRILSLGPMVRVLSPESFKEKIRDRLRRQKELGDGLETGDGSVETGDGSVSP